MAAGEAQASVSLYERINRVKRDCHRLKKTGTNAHFGYKYATESDISDMLRPLMAEHGVCLLYKGPERETVSIEWGEKQALYRVWVRYELVNVDNPAEREVLVCPGEALDSQDKGMNKALTAAAKYAWLKIFDISTGEPADDPDNGGGTEPVKPKISRAKTEPKPPPAKPVAPEVSTPPAPGDPDMRPAGDEWARVLYNRLAERCITLAQLRHVMYKKFGAGVFLKGIEEFPEKWPRGLGADIKRCLEDFPVVPNNPADLELTLRSAAAVEWQKQLGGKRPPDGMPSTIDEMIDAMKENLNWKQYPAGPDRTRQMIEDLKAGKVLVPNGTLIPF